MIDEKKLVEVLEDYKNNEWNKTLYTLLPAVVDDCIDFVENQSKIGEWIPCSEKLPDSEKEVLITFDFKGRRSVDIGTIGEDGTAYCYSDEYLTPEGRRYRKAVAWMDIPSPYKG